MYKCTECGLEFEKKPDYCDCGNDEFVLTVQDNAEIGTPEPVQDNVKSIKPQTIISEKVSVNNIPSSYSIEKESFKLPVNPFAISVFIICIVLSIWIIFVWNPTPATTEKVSQTVEKVENNAIPSIDKLWKESAYKPQPIKEQVIPVVKEEPVKKVTTVPLTKISTKTTKTQNKPVVKSPTTQNTTTKTTSLVKNTSSDDAAQKALEEAKKALEAKQKAEAEALAAAEKAKKQALAKQELANYKINLRNEIGKKIDFTRVIGDGDCVISFKLDSTGRLINRTFARQSTNITLNNAVYNAVMATPSYNPPPSAYNHETYHLYINFTNGNFAITLD